MIISQIDVLSSRTLEISENVLNFKFHFVCLRCHVIVESKKSTPQNIGNATNNVIVTKDMARDTPVHF